MKRTAVSIILPTFNRLGYLRTAIDSVLAQTYSDWELVIADDGSGSETVAYLESLAGRPQVRLLKLAHTGNPAAVRNAALTEARGDYIAFLDSDDVWLPCKLELQLALHRERTRCSWSYTAEELIDASGQILRPQAQPPVALHEGLIFEQLLTLEAALSVPCVMVERRLVEEVGGFDEHIAFFEDYDLWFRLSRRSEVAALNQPLALVRNHHEHYSANRVAVYEARFRLLEKVAAAGIDERCQAILSQERAKTSAALARVHAAAGRRQDALKMLWRSRALAGRNTQWWSGAIHTLALVGATPALRASVRGYRARKRGI